MGNFIRITMCWWVNLEKIDFFIKSEALKWIYMFMCSVASDSIIPRTIVCQAPLFMEFSRQEYWSRLLFIPPEDLSNQGLKPASFASPVLADGFFTTVPPWEAMYVHTHTHGFLGAQMVRNPLWCRRLSFHPWIGKIPWRREWLPTPVFVPGEFHRQRRLAGYIPWGHKESDTTERQTLSTLP